MSLQSRISHLVLKYLAVPRMPAVLPDKKHVACIGDSITFGAGVRGKTQLTWEYALNRLLGSEYQVLNYGIRGRTLQDEGDYPYTAEKFYPASLRLCAETYLILLGTNDAKPYNWDAERYERELHAFVKGYTALENRPRVLLMTPPRCYADPKRGKVAFDIDPDVVDGPVCEAIRRQAALLGLQVIDLNTFTKGQADWFTDGVHPNAEGNRNIAAYIVKQLR